MSRMTPRARDCRRRSRRSVCSMTACSSVMSDWIDVSKMSPRARMGMRMSLLPSTHRTDALPDEPQCFGETTAQRALRAHAGQVHIQPDQRLGHVGTEAGNDDLCFNQGYGDH